MRFETTPPPAPSWDKHLEPEVSAQLVTGCEQTKRELDEYATSRARLLAMAVADINSTPDYDPDPENDGLEVVA